MNITAYTKIGNHGWEAYAFSINEQLDCSENIIITYSSSGCEEKNATINSVYFDGEYTVMEVTPFPYLHTAIKLQYRELVLDNTDIVEIRTDGADDFVPKNENGVLYRIHIPESSGPRPLILFLHGGTECGSDNWMQLVGTLGAVKLANDYPDMYVMAPQAPFSIFDNSNGKTPDFNMPFAHSNQSGKQGWYRQYLASICDIIRNMIEKGNVDAGRIYVTGLSMGGAGAIRMMSVGNGLFTAGAPICPTMTPEILGILKSLTDSRIWISCSYLDHTLYRHKYIVDGILALRDQGNNNAHLTIYSPEELSAYGIASDTNMSFTEMISENHACWILTYNNEHQIMDWLVNQTN